MIIELIAAMSLAKFRHYNLKYAFYTWTFYPVLLTQGILIFFQMSIFFGTYYFLQFVPIVEPIIILSFLFAIFAFRLYTPAIVGSVCIGIGSMLNKFVMAQNGGLMPVYPSLSYLTGYATAQSFQIADGVHILGSDVTRYKLLTDYIDFGYCILSPGDVFIHLFTFLMLYAIFKAAHQHYSSRQTKRYQ
ncbi:MAG: DUF5317 domain-containing protein [Negativicutes bacterium]|nr:DUF5317 domain-containing protein [Negativicutes bacterium]